jgi:glutathionyl-hydroquinone reductase
MIEPQFAAKQSETGKFQRQEDAFRDWISAGGSIPDPAGIGRAHLHAKTLRGRVFCHYLTCKSQ